MTDRLKWFVMSDHATDIIPCDDEPHARMVFALSGPHYNQLQGIDPETGHLVKYARKDYKYPWTISFRLTDTHLAKLGIVIHARNDRLDTKQARPSQERLQKSAAR